VAENTDHMQDDEVSKIVESQLVLGRVSFHVSAGTCFISRTYD